MNRRLKEACTAAAIASVLVAFLAINIWWISQKWEACGKLYDNQVARMICLSASS